MKRKRIEMMAETAISIALATILSLIRFYKLPTGGSITLVMLPLLINGFRNGTKYGLIASISFACINFILDGMYLHWGSIIFDYLLAYGILGLSGLFSKKGKKMSNYIICIVVLCFVRYLFHSLSGFIFFRDVTSTIKESLIYSFVIYNGPYMFGSSLITLLIAIPLHQVLYYKR